MFWSYSETWGLMIQFDEHIFQMEGKTVHLLVCFSGWG